MRADPGQHGLALVEVLMVLAIIPIILGIAYGALVIGMRATATARDTVSLAGEASRIVEEISADARGACRILEGSDDRSLRLMNKDGLQVEYVVYSAPPSSEGPHTGGTILRNGYPILREGIYVESCTFTYYGPGDSPGGAGLPLSDAANATGVGISLTLGSGGRTYATHSFVSLRCR